MIDFIVEKMKACGKSQAVAAEGALISYSQLVCRYEWWINWLSTQGLLRGAAVSFDGDYTADSISLFLALIRNRNIIIPLSADSGAHHREFRELASAEYIIRRKGELPVLEKTSAQADHPFYTEIRNRDVPGLVLFSSGSTGRSKAAVHDFSLLLKKFQKPRKVLRTVIFLQLDHIGGINTLLYTLSNGGFIIAPSDRHPGTVCRAIQNYRAELLPTSPTFLNLLLLSGEHQAYDLSSLTLISYGTEPMPQSTLDAAAAAFPNARLLQTYGLSEIGIMASKSKENQSLWIKVGGDGFETKIVNNRLFIRSESAMLGYLNAPSPFDEEGFIDTGDLVEQDGDWLRILGRESELINVGGFKVFPAEVESVLLQMDNVEDAAAYGLDHAITGKMVAAHVRLRSPENPQDFKVRMRRFCKSRLQPFKIPAKITITEKYLHSERFKRMRKSAADEIAASGK